MSDKVKGFLFGAVAAATYGMNPLFALPLYREGLNADSVLFYRYTLAIVMLGIWMKLQRQSFRLNGNEILPLVIAGLLFAASSLFLFLSYRHMDAGIASTILFVYPVMVAVIMALFFHEKATPVTVASIVLALSGIALLYRGGDGGPLSFAGILLVILSALSYAIYIVGVKQSALKNLSGAKLTFYSLLFGLSIYIVRLDFCLGLQVVPSWQSWGNVVAIALLPTVVSLSCTALAIHYIGATPTAILGALEPVTAVFFGVAVFGESLTFRLVAGILLIIVSVSLIIAGRTVQKSLNELFRRLFRRA
ncbi:DMT family transporter [Victivallis sp. Marseille-Q1083]|uniref:EamA family transporter n=1 Tax=Victivallis sp. Marseille-Q1083 TaxID=2717288 RepID=UPI001589B8DA|nr:DMT family transporter [Victivallis sp. Marseille-Q1083]